MATIITHLILVVLICQCIGFLLDNKPSTSVAPNPSLFDHQYKALLNLINIERDSRLALEQRVVHLENELLATQQGVTDVYHATQRYNKTFQEQSVLNMWNEETLGE